MAAFGLRFNIRKFLKEKFSGKIALAYFMYYKSLQVGQLPQEHLSFLQNLLNLIISNNLKQKVNDELIVCMNECRPGGLSITGDIKIYQCHIKR